MKKQTLPITLFVLVAVLSQCTAYAKETAAYVNGATSIMENVDSISVSSFPDSVFVVTTDGTLWLWTMFAAAQ